jgi:hypothetical protein
MNSPQHPSVVGLVCLTLFLASVPALGAGRHPDGDALPLRAAGPGRVEQDFERDVPTELLSLEEGLAPALLALANDDTVRVEDWPVAPDRREPVVLTRREVYAPGAHIFRIDRGRRVEVPRSRLVFLWGAAEQDVEARVLVAVDPESRAIEGFVDAHEGKQELRPAPEQGRGPDGRALYRLAPPEVFLAPGEDPDAEGWSCGAAEAPQAIPLTFEGAASTAVFEDAITSLHTATVAIDTDNEFMALKFADNTTAASNYIAQLIAAMNVFYERDLKIRLVQGTTFLRVSSTPDPWTGGTGNADAAKLQQFTNYWSANYGGVSRAMAAMLSGKQPSGSSGIAWVGGLCSTSTGYSFSQVFRSSTNGSSDAFVVGHEIGHNFGTNHTHCYLTPTPIDTCYNAQQGCWSGPTSCPAETNMNGVLARGTLMSYCHLLSGCRADRVFHPRTVDLLNPIIESKVGICVFPAVSAPTIAAVKPNSGSTAGGTAITITGTGFQAGATVSLGGVPATSVVVVGSTTITAVTGAHATGAVSAVVTNPDGGSATLANAFFYAPPPAALGFYTLTPCRVIDTRNPNGPLGGPALGAGALRTFDVTGTCGIPNGAQAISVNVTVVGPTAPGNLAFYPGNAFPLGTSTINFAAGATRANNAVLGLATNGAGTIGVQNASAGATQLLLDVNGYFQ